MRRALPRLPLQTRHPARCQDPKKVSSPLLPCPLKRFAPQPVRWFPLDRNSCALADRIRQFEDPFRDSCASGLGNRNPCAFQRMLMCWGPVNGGLSAEESVESIPGQAGLLSVWLRLCTRNTRPRSFACPYPQRASVLSDRRAQILVAKSPTLHGDLGEFIGVATLQTIARRGSLEEACLLCRCALS